MTPDEILQAAIGKKSPAERAAYLDGACGQDAALRALVEGLLKANAQAGSFLEQPLFEPGPTMEQAPPLVESPGTVIGQYKLLEQIGEGGFGIVFMAEQTEPVRRKVALKVLKPGMDTRQVVARFEAERQALALMDHPNIAHVFDGGETASGRPYFVMELVRGVPITAFCDQSHLAVRARLELFASVCQAVQHAHQKGIIHRDIKPTNVLVTLHDDKPVVKVIDFGIAKATGQQLTEKTLFTNFAQMIGTPMYMSPEQAQMSGLDIDTRSDIYSLGVLLYELLTGTTPFDQERLRTAAFDEIRRIIREEEPPKPSTRVSTLGQAASVVSANRKSDPKQLSQLIRGELDWIVMKCLDKDRNRRYETANSFALDVQRYLADEPVQACPPSSSYRLRKFVRRNKGPVLAALAIFLLLVGGIVGTTWGLVRAVDEREQKEEARQTAEANEVKARAAAQAEGSAKLKALEAAEAEKKAWLAEAAERKQAEAVAAVLEALFRGLDPALAAKDLKGQLARQLDETAAGLEKEYAGQPLVRARLRTALGITQHGLGEYDKAAALHELALEERRTHLEADHPDTLRSLNLLAEAHRMAGRPKEALPLQKEVREKSRLKRGENHPDTLTSMNNLALVYVDLGRHDLALPLFAEVLPKRTTELGPDDAGTLTTMNNLGQMYLYAREPKKALPLIEEALARRRKILPADHPNILRNMNDLGGAYSLLGRFDEALSLHQEALKKQRALLGDHHHDTLRTLNGLAVAYVLSRRSEEALPLLEEAFELLKSKADPDHPLLLSTTCNLGRAYWETGRLKQAIPLLTEALDKLKAADHPYTLVAMNYLGNAYMDAKKPDKGLPLLEESHAKAIATLDPNHPDVLAGTISLGTAYARVKRYDKAIEAYEKVLALERERFGPSHADTLRTINALAKLYRQADRLNEARALGEEELKLLEALPGTKRVKIMLVRAGLASLYDRLGELELGESMWKKVVELVRTLAPDELRPDDPGLATTLTGLATNLIRQKKYAEAEPHLREAIAIYTERTPEESFRFVAMSLLGDSLRAQKNYAAAEELLLQGYGGIKEKGKKEVPPLAPGFLADAVQRLAQLYDDWGKKERADAWRGKLEPSQEARWKEAQAHYKRAEELLQGGKPAAAEGVLWKAVGLEPDFPDAYCYLGLALARQGRLTQAETAYREAMHLMPKLAVAHVGLGNVYAQAGQWAKATAMFDEGLKLNPNFYGWWFQRAVLYLHAGDVDNYRRACREMLERFGKTEKQDIAGSVAKICALAPDAVADAALPAKLADQALSGKEKPHRYLLTKGMADYRAGRYAAAALRLKECSPKADGGKEDAAVFVVLAMAHHRLGEAEEARAALTNARAIISDKMPEPAKGRPFGDDWIYWLQCQILYREAEAVLNGKDKKK